MFGENFVCSALSFAEHRVVLFASMAFAIQVEVCILHTGVGACSQVDSGVSGLAANFLTWFGSDAGLAIQLSIDGVLFYQSMSLLLFAGGGGAGQVSKPTMSHFDLPDLLEVSPSMF
jgi:hypothetical protein